MKAIHLLLWFAGLLIAAVEFSGCADHINPQPPLPRLRVKTLTQYLPDPIVPRIILSTSVSSFTYDAQNRLSVIDTYTTKPPTNSVVSTEHSAYQYDAQNRLTQLNRAIYTPGNSTSNQSEVYRFSYNETGQVSKLNYSNSGPNGGGWEITPTYAANKLVGNSKTYSTGGLSYNESDTYTYTGNNLTFAAATSVLDVKQTILNAKLNANYTYDDKINPFYGLYIIPAPGQVAGIPTGSVFSYYTYYGGIANLLNLSQNNVLSSSFSNGVIGTESTSYTYTYNSDNLPVSRFTITSTSLPSTLFRETLVYEYESY